MTHSGEVTMAAANWESSSGKALSDARGDRVLVFECAPAWHYGVIVWRVEAQAGMEHKQLIRVMAEKYAPGLARRSMEVRDRALRDHVLQLAKPLRIVVEHADRLPPRTLAKMPSLSEELAPVVLEGHLMKIGAKMQGDEGFMQRARFCVQL
jgi:hypothetical protein